MDVCPTLGLIPVPVVQKVDRLAPLGAMEGISRGIGAMMGLDVLGYQAGERTRSVFRWQILYVENGVGADVGPFGCTRSDT